MRAEQWLHSEAYTGQSTRWERYQDAIYSSVQYSIMSVGSSSTGRKSLHRFCGISRICALARHTDVNPDLLLSTFPYIHVNQDKEVMKRAELGLSCLDERKWKLAENTT